MQTNYIFYDIVKNGNIFKMFFKLQILRLSITVSNRYNVGTILNLLSSDVSKFEDYCMFWHYTWVLPIQGILMAVFIWDKVGVASLAGLLCLALQTVYIQRNYLFFQFLRIIIVLPLMFQK